jgi:putative tricarboxylic transport membrane protein
VSDAPRQRPAPLLAALPALFLAALAAIVWFATSELRLWRGVTPGPRFFPMLLAIAGGVIALLLLLGQWRGREEASLDLPDRHGLKQVAITIAALVALAAGTPVIGMVPMVAIFVLGMLLLVLRERLLPSLFATAIVALGLQAIFVMWLDVALP